jgi:hypothetical protein
VAGQTVAISCEPRTTLISTTEAGSHGTRGTLPSAFWWFCGCWAITASRNKAPIRPRLPHHALRASESTVATPTTDTQSRTPMRDSITRRPVAAVGAHTIGCVVATCWKQCQLLQTMITSNQLKEYLSTYCPINHSLYKLASHFLAAIRINAW